MNKWGIKKLDGTIGFKEVDLEDMANAYAINNNRGYNENSIEQLDNLLILSSPTPPNFIGEHYTLVLNVEDYSLSEILGMFVVSEHIETERSVKEKIKQDIKRNLNNTLECL